jgi:hypothetical protein
LSNISITCKKSNIVHSLETWTVKQKEWFEEDKMWFTWGTMTRWTVMSCTFICWKHPKQRSKERQRISGCI